MINSRVRIGCRLPVVASLTLFAACADRTKPRAERHDVARAPSEETVTTGSIAAQGPQTRAGRGQSGDRVADDNATTEGVVVTSSFRFLCLVASCRAN